MNYICLEPWHIEDGKWEDSQARQYFYWPNFCGGFFYNFHGMETVEHFRAVLETMFEDRDKWPHGTSKMILAAITKNQVQTKIALEKYGFKLFNEFRNTTGMLVYTYFLMYGKDNDGNLIG